MAKQNQNKINLEDVLSRKGKSIGAEFLQLSEGEEINLILRKIGEFTNKEEESRPALFFEDFEGLNFITSSGQLIYKIKKFAEENDVLGSLIRITFLGKKGTGQDQYNDYLVSYIATPEEVTQLGY